ncbi:MAG TPA: MCP four helix bundle domain-containing protein [Polyangiales bacterium]
MRTSIRLSSLVIACILLLASSALASPADDTLKSLLAARQSLVTMLDTTDGAAQSKLQGEIAQHTKSVDAAVAAALADKATSADAAAKFKEFKSIWDAFKKTRDGEIVPAIRAGKVDQAKALAKGVQAERLAKMKDLLAALGAK